MRDHELAIGIDGGATHVNWCVRVGGDSFRDGATPGANRQSMEWNAYRARLEATLDAAVAACGATRRTVRSIGMGLAGVDRPEDIEPLRAWLRQAFPGLERCWIGSDAFPALREGADRLEGLVLVAGTGSICYGIAPDGRSVRVGGWGGMLGDEGSAFWIGREALQIATRMSDGRVTRTILLDRLLERLKLDEPGALIQWIYDRRGDDQRASIAQVAPLVVELAAEEASSKKIVRQAVGHMADHVTTAAAGLARLPGVKLQPPLKVICAGGIFTTGSHMLEALNKTLTKLTSRFELIAHAGSSAKGALMLGEELGT
jgi:N-acetylglucosamine kinase-like BadF-type ATPase